MSGSQQLLLGGAPTVTPVDPYFYSVTSLLHGDGTNGGQNNTFLDSSTNNFTITRNGNTTQGSFSPFSQTGWSNYFDGTGDYLTAPSNAAFQFGTGDFTIECWSYVTGGDNQLFYDFRSSFVSNNGFNFGRSNADGFYVYNNVEGVIIGSGAGTAATNTYVHVAVSRSGSTLRLFINGILVKTATNSTNYNSTAVPTIGGSSTTLGTPGNLYTGYISNLRVVKGTAVYTADFTVPTTPLTAISGTSLLTCQANRFLDASSNAFAITRAGDVSVQPFSPFNPTTAYSTSAVGGSGYFDGSGDYLQVASGTNALTLTTNFTIEWWLYRTSNGDYAYIAQGGGAGDFNLTNGIAFQLYQTATTFYFDWNNGGSFTSITTAAANVPLNQWNHIALGNNGTTTRIWVNGTSVTSTTSGATWGTPTTRNVLYVGRLTHTAGYQANGFISGMRVVTSDVYGAGNTTITVPTAPLTAITNTQLLTNYTNGAIFDNAADADYETVGNAQISTSVKKYGTGSIAFDGTGDYLVADAPSTQLMTFGTGDFTIEFWLYVSALPSAGTYNVIYDSRPSGTNGLYPTITLKGSTLVYYTNTADQITSGSISATTWYHVALCRTASQTKLFINGTQVGSTYADTNAYINATSRPLIGDSGNTPGSTNALNGYIDDLRISKGVARYPYNFTPPTAEFPNIGGTVTLTADPYFDYTTLLLPGNGTNGAQNNTFLDSSSNAFSITRNGNTTQGTFSPFSQTGWGNYFDASGDYLTIASNTAFALPGDFTLEMWVYPSTITGALFGIGDYRAGNNGFSLYYFSSKLRLYVNGADVLVSASDIPLNTWLHFAVVRSGSGSNNLKLYINGTQQAQATNTVSFTGVSGNGASVNNDYGGSFAGTVPSGYLSNVRLVKGTAVYTADFTPPTAPLTAISGTSLLTCQSNRFIDNSTNNFTITRNGDVSVQAFSPFNPTAAWSAATYGGSGYFDGSGDYLTAPNNSATDLGSGDFTVEAWIYTNSTNAYQGIIQKYFGPGAYNGWSFRFDNTGKIQFYCADGSASEFTVTGTSTCNNNAWHHVAAVRSGSTVAIYVDGVRENTGTCSFTISSTSSVYIGQHFNGAFVYTGYIAALRVVKGSAVYSGTTYTVPTSPPTAITNTSLLLNYTNAGIYDATSKNDLETVGNAQISTTQSKFDGSSMYFDGDDKLVGRTSPNLNMGSGDFTVECWVYWAGTNTSYQNFVGSNSGSFSGNATFFRVWGASVATLGSKVGIGNPTHDATSSVYSVNSIPVNTWTHVAATRYNGIIRVFINGVLERTGSTDTSTYDFGDNGICVGQAPWDGANGYYTGYIDDLRITKGIARYTSNFTPPSTPFLTL